MSVAFEFQVYCRREGLPPLYVSPVLGYFCEHCQRWHVLGGRLFPLHTRYQPAEGVMMLAADDAGNVDTVAIPPYRID